MRTPRSMAVTTLTAAAIALSAGPTAAAPPGSVHASPDPVARGHNVTLSTTDCGRKKPTALVTVFGIAHKNRKVLLVPKSRFPGKKIQGKLHIPKNTKKGPHRISGRCANGRRLTGTLVVIPAR